MKKLLTSIFLITAFLIPATVSAAAPVNNPVDPFDDICKRANANSVDIPSACQDKNLNGGNPLYGPEGLITKVVNIITLIVGIAAVISVIYAGLRLVVAGDNPEEVSKAREYIQYAAIGLILAALSQVLVRLVLFKIFENRVI